MGKGADASFGKHGTPRRNIGLPRRLGEDFELGALASPSPKPKEKRSAERSEVNPSRPRKRQRSTNGKHSALYESSWPRTAEELWEWEPLQNQFAEISDFEVDLLQCPLVDGSSIQKDSRSTGICFRTLPNGNEPLGSHYSAEWLREDAADLNDSRYGTYDVNQAVEFDRSMLGNYRYVVGEDQERACKDGMEPLNLSSPQSPGDYAKQSSDDYVSSTRSIDLRGLQCFDKKSEEKSGMPRAMSPVPQSPSCDESVVSVQPAMSPDVKCLATSAPMRSLETRSPWLSSPLTTRTRRISHQSPKPLDLGRPLPSDFVVKLEFVGCGEHLGVESEYRLPLRCTSVRSESGKNGGDEQSPFDTFQTGLNDTWSYEVKGRQIAAGTTDELRDEIMRLRKELFRVSEVHKPVRERVLNLVAKDSDSQGQMRKLVEEERDILEQLKKCRQAKLRRRKKKEAAVAAAFQASAEAVSTSSRNVVRVAKDGDLKVVVAHPKRKKDSIVEALREISQLKAVRAEMERMRNLADSCLEREKLKRRKTETHFDHLRKRVELAESKFVDKTQ
mmetsp:Transcript_7015/g.21356  ORF Transcript_7015/g.21356 Transcript_7015/m.21356 type:complete len:559 (+) Transcript_7015:232-1908(+)